MSTNIRFKRSDVPGKVPSLDALELGELAINSADGKLFTKQEMKPPGGLAAIQKIVEIGATSVPNVLYVSKGGDDSNSGKTLGESFASLKKALSIATPGTTIFLKSGEYIEDNPLRVPARVSVVGDNLRNTTVRPKNPTKDIFWVYNGAYIFCMNFKGHIAPSAAVCFPPDGSAGEIVTSPYTQAVTSITTTGTGMRVDGAVTTGLRSMVCDAFTQYNQGGVGIHMLNRGNTQLVSIFTICCDISFLCESGGFCSVNLSNSSFGNYGLVSRGASQILYRGVVKKSSGRQITFKNLAKRPNIGDGVLFANYNQATCNRDNGLVVDSLAFDLLYEGTTQSTFAGLRYWAKDIIEIADQGEETVAAIDFAQKLVKKIVANQNPTALQDNVSVTLPGSALSLTAQRLVNDEFSIVSKIVKNGPISPQVVIYADYDLAEPELKFLREQVLERKAEIQDQTIAFINRTYSTLSYIQSKCYRDIGIIIDAVINDMVFGSNYLSVKAARTYLSIKDSLVIPAETKTATIEAVKFARDKVVALLTENSIASLAAAANFKIITDALADADLSGESASLNSRNLSYPVYQDLDENVKNLVLNLQANKEFIKDNVKQYLYDNYVELRDNYSEDTCTRDVGYVLDALCYDMSYGGNSETLDVAKRYYSYANGQKQIPDYEVVATTDAYGRVQLLSQRVIINDVIQVTGLDHTQNVSGTPTNQTQVNRLGGLFQLFLKQIEKEIVATSDFIQPNGAKLDDAALDAAYDSLQANKAFVKAEVIAYLTNSYPAFSYDRVKCARDIGYIIDSICFDITHGGNRQIVQAGIYYYGFNEKSNVLKSVLPKQINQTVNAYLYLKELLADVISCKPTPNPWQGVVPQRTDLPAATAAESGTINNLIDVIVEILREGPNNAEDSVERARQAISLTASSDVNKVRAFDLLLANKEFIQAELKAYININWYEISDGDTQFARVSKATELTLGTTTTGYPVTTYQPASLKAIRDAILAAKEDIKTETIKFMANSFFDNFSFNKPKCYRDVGLILDAILSDMIFGSNYKTITAAASYFRAYASDVIGPQKVQTIASLEAAKALTLERVVTPAAKTAISTRFDILLDIIKNGTVENPFATAPAITYPPVLRNSDEDIERKQALDIVQANKNFIKDEIADFVDANFTLTDYDRVKCARDVGLIIDALGWDLMFGSNARAITAGRSYQRVDAAKVVKNQKLATIGAFKQLKKLLTQAVKSNTLAVNSIQRGMDIIIEIVESNGQKVPKHIVPFPASGRDIGYKKARDLVEKNREFIVSEVLAFVNAGGNSDYGFDVPVGYDEVKCERDLNLILDAVYYDITYGGTLETEVAARSYFVGTLSQLNPSGDNDDEVDATLAAYNYLKDVLAQVAVDSAVARTTGNTSVQLRSPTGSDGNAQAAADMVALVNLIRLYITQGNASAGAVTIAGAVSQPSTKWVESSLVDQYKLLQSQKVSLKDAIVDYVNTNYVIFGYDRDTCARDVGLVIDAVRYDMMFDSNFQSITAGRSYWRAQASVVRDDQKVATLAAFELLKTKLVAVVNNNATAKASVTASMDAILAIIDRGLTAAPVVKWTQPAAQTIESGIVNTNAYDTAYFTARGVIQTNKETVVSEINQWVIDAYNNGNGTYAGDGFIYGEAQQANCQRDLRFIIDAVCYDLTYGGTMQSDIAARAYKSGIGENLPVLVSGDLNATRDAYLQLATNLKNRVTGADVKTRVDDLVKRISGIIGGTVTSATTLPPTDWVDASLTTLGAATLSGSLNNTNFKNTTKAAITAFVDANYAYNKDKCKRDVGYLLDAMCYDLLYGGNVDTVSAAQSYFNGAIVPQSIIPKEIIQTVAAYERLKDVIQDVVQLRDVVPSSNKFVATESIIGNMDLVNRILDSGESVAPTRPWALPLPTGGLENAHKVAYLNARNLIAANREFIKAETIAFITKYKTDNSLPFTYNETTCLRDIDYILDAIYYDMTYGGNLQTSIAAQAYYPSDSVLPNDQIATTVATFAHLATILEKLARGTTITPTNGNTVTPKVGTTDQQDTVSPFVGATHASDLMTLISEYVDGDPLASPAEPETNWVDSGLRTISTLINLINSDTYTVDSVSYDGIRKKVTDYINANYPALVTDNYDDVACRRDVGLILDAIRWDMLFGTNFASTIAGRAYYRKAVNLNADGLADVGGSKQKEAALTALRYAKSLVLEAVIANTPTQDKAGILGSEEAADKTQIMINLVYNAVNSGAIPSQTAPTTDDLAWVDPDLVAISTTMNSANTNTGSGLQKQITDHIALNYSSNSLVNSTADTSNLITADSHGLVPNQVIVFEGTTTGTGLTALTAYYVLAAGYTSNTFKVSTTKGGTAVTLTTNASVTDLKISNYNVMSCQRDVGYVIDAIRYDMMFDSNFRTITAARSYYRAQAAVVVGVQKAATISSFELLKEKLVALASGNEVAKSRVTDRMNLLLKVLDKGLEVIPEFNLPSPTNYNTSSFKEHYGNSRNLIASNREFFKAEITKKISETDSKIRYNAQTCLRDVDYIIDAVCYDLTYGGTMESAIAARAYYQGTAPDDSLPNAEQKTATAAAFDYLKDLVYGVARNRDLSLKQVKVPQVFGPRSSLVAGQASRNLVWGIRDYISTSTPDPEKVFPDISWTPTAVKQFATLLGKYKTNNLVATTAEPTVRISYADQLTKYSIQNLGGQSVVSIDNNNNTITVTGHGFENLDVVVFEGTLTGTGIAADTTYYVRNKTTDTFTISASKLDSTPIDILSTTISGVKVNNYNVEKCKRDVNLILDAIRLDMAFNTNFKTIVAARSYLRRQAGAIIDAPTYAEQKAASKQLFEELKARVLALAARNVDAPSAVGSWGNGGGGGGANSGNNQEIITRITSLMNLVIDTIEAGDDSELPEKPFSLPVPTGLSTALGTPINSFDRGYLNARNSIEINREFIKAEVIAWIDDQARKGVNGFNSNLDGTPFVYDRTDCLRDLDYVLDGVYYDLTYGGNTESVNNGISYYAGLSDPSLEDADAYASEQAYDFLGKLVLDVTRNVQVDTVQTAVPQIRGVAGGDKAAQTLAILSDTIINIVKGGVKQVPERVDPDFLAGDETLAYVRSTLQEQKKNLQARIADYIDSYILQYNTDKCARDVGLIIDCVMYDLVLNSNFQTITAGSVYLQKAAGVVTSYQLGPQLEAIRFIRDKCIEVSKAPPLTENLTAIAEINNRFDILYDIVDKGVEAAPPVVNVPPQGAAYNPNAINAAKSIIANKEFLKEEATAYITANYKTYDQSRCARDVGLIIDAALFDLLLGTSYNSIKAGLSYRRATSSLVVSDQLTETLGGIDYALRRVVALTDDAEAISSITSSFELIKSIISKGSVPSIDLPLAGGSVYALPRATGREYRNVGYFDAVAAIKAAVVDIKSAVSTFISTQVTAGENPAFKGFNYDSNRQTACETDIGYILEALCYDLTYGGNMETVNAGRAYYAGVTGVDPSLAGDGTEIAATYEAYTFLAKYISEVTLNNISSDIAVEAERLVLGIRNLVDAGVTSNPVLIAPDVSWVDSELTTLDGNILTEKERIKNDIINFVNSNKDGGPSGVFESKCRDDLSYILDAVFWDMVTNSNYQSVTAGLAYRRLDASKVLTIDQKFATIRALEKAKLLAVDVMSNSTAIARLREKLTIVIDIISDTTYDTSVPSLSFPNNTVTATDEQKNAASALQANKADIISGISSFLENYTTGGFTWNDFTDDRQAICLRDVGFIVDALTHDALYGGNWATVIAARSYFVGASAQLGADSVEVIATKDAYAELKTQIEDSVADATLQSRVKGLIQNIIDYIGGNGTNPALPAITKPTLTGGNAGILSDKTTLVTQKQDIIDDVIDHITTTSYVGYDQAKCARDVDYIIDALRYDILFNSNFRSIVAGRSYQRESAQRVYAGGAENTATYAAITQLRSLLLDVIIKNASVNVTALAQQTLKNNSIVIRQLLEGDYDVTNEPALPSTLGSVSGTISAIEDTPNTTKLVTVSSTIGIAPGMILTKVSGTGAFGTNPQITNINSATTFTVTAETALTNGSLVFTVQGNYPAGGETDAEIASAKLDIIKARANIVANKAFIKAEVLAYINQEKTANRGNFNGNAYPNFVFDTAQQAACARDLDYILDAFIYDLTYGGNLETTVAGSAYYNGTALPEGEKLATLDAYKYLRFILDKVATASSIADAIETGYVAGTAGSSEEITALVNLVIDFVDACPADPKVVTPNTDWVPSKLFVFSNALNSAKSTVAKTTTDYVKANFPELGDAFVTKCQRDIGLIIDAVRWDMMFGSNFRTAVAARSYYRAQASEVLGVQKAATKAAFGIVKTALQDIVKSDTTAYTRVGASMDLVINIVENDNNVPALAIPYGGTVSSFDTGYLAARDCIEANRDYIKAQVAAYIDDNGTNPPGFSLATCLRDVDYFLDAVRYDLTYGGNLATVEAGRAYYEGTVLNNGNSTHILETYDTFNFVKGLIKNIAMNDPSGSSYSVTPVQSTDGLDGSESGGDAAVLLFADLLTFIDNDLATVATTGVAGQFSCAATNKLSVGATVTITGALDTGVGKGTITGYASGNVYKVSATNGSTTFTLTTSTDAAIVTTAGAITGVRFSVSSAAERLPNTSWVNSQFVSFATTMDDTKVSLETQVTDYIDANFPDPFTYDKVKCARDVGLVIDAVRYDMMFDNSFRTYVAGRAYYRNVINLDGDALASLGQKDATLAAFTFLKTKLLDIVKGNAEATKRVTSAMRTLLDTLDLGETTRNSYDPVVRLAIELLGANKALLLTQMGTYLDDPNGDLSGPYTFTGYSKTTCLRDVGYVIDAIKYDLTYGGNMETVVAGNAYYQGQVLGDSDAAHINATTAAFAHLSDLIADISDFPASVADRVTELLTNVDDLITEDPVTEVYADATWADVDLKEISATMSNNKVALGTAITNYVTANYPAISNTFVTKCSRDVGLVIDAVRWDMLFASNFRSVIAGRAYYRKAINLNIDGLAGIGQKKASIAAFSYLKEQLLALTSSNGTATSRIAANMDIILEILETGLDAGEVDTVPTINSTVIPNGTRTEVKYNAAKNYLLSNKDDIVDDVIAYINSDLGPFTEQGGATGYNEEKCARDVGYIVTAVAYDLVTGSNYQSTIAALRYLGNSAINVLGDKEKHMTILSLRHLKTLMASIVANNTDAVNAVKASMNLIIRIINEGSDPLKHDTVRDDALGDILFPTDKVTSQAQAGMGSAARTAVKSEITRWLSATTGTNYDGGSFWGTFTDADKRAQCTRDVGYIFDAIRYDLTYGGTWATTIAARAYYAGTVANLDPNGDNSAEITATLAAYEYLKTELQTNRVSGNTLEDATVTNVTKVGQLIDIIKTVISGGLDVLPTVEYPQLLGASSALGYSVAKNNLLNSIDILKTKTVRYINERTYFQYDSVKCERDLGYILDAVFYDVLTNSNYQSVTAGLAYARLDAAEAISAPQKFAILAALTYAKSVLANLVSTTATVVSRIRSKLSIIIDIINDEADPDLLPTLDFPTIGLTGTTDSNTLQADKEDIQDAITAYLTTSYNGGAFWSSFTDTTKRAKCRRDVGYIVDALTYDLTYGGNWATVINARAYFAGTKAQLDANGDNAAEITATIAAYGELKNQVAGSVGAQSTRASELIQYIIDYIGGDGTDPALESIDYPTAESSTPAINTAVKVKLFEARDDAIVTIQENINNVPYIRNNAYNSVKCKRDVDIILNAIGWDLMFDTTYRSVKAGQSYLRSYSKTVTSEQKAATIGALYFVKTRLGTYVTDAGVLADARTLMDIIIDILDRGAAALPVSTDPTVPAIAMPNPTSGTAGTGGVNAYAYAVTTIFNNTDFLKAEIRAWIARNYPELDYDKNTCERDVAYILEALRYDMTYGGNSQTVEAGRAYWEGNALTLGITPTDPTDPNYLNDPNLDNAEDEKPATIGAYKYLGTLLYNLIYGNTITPLQNIITKGTQVGSGNGTVAGRAQALIAGTNSDGLGGIVKIIDRLSLASAEAAVTPVDPEYAWVTTANSALSDAYEGLSGGSATVQTAVVDEIDSAYGDQWFVYNEDKCARDLGFIVEALAYDLAYGGNSQTRDSGLQYLYKGGIVIPTGTKGPTLLAIGNVDSTDNALTKVVYTRLNAIGGGYTAIASEAVSILTNNVYNVLKTGVAPALVIPTLTNAETKYKLLRDLVLDNVPGIQDATIKYINETYAGFGYKQETCKRDIGLTLDAVAYDLIYGGNSRTKYAAEQYFSGGRLQIPADSKTATAACFNYLDALVRLVIKNDYITPFQLFASQDTSNVAATNGEVNNVAALFEAFTDIVTNGYISVVTLDATFKSVVDDNTYATFHQVSQITTTGHTLEWVGTGIDVDSALPYNGGVPIEANEIVSENGGFINFTSTDQKGDFKIGPELTIKRDSGSIVGRAFNKSLLGVITPYILALNE